MSRMSCVRSRTRQGSALSRLRSCVGERSWSKSTRSAPVEAATPAISSTLPAPLSVAGSGRARRCKSSAAISAPALETSSRNSARDSSASRAVDWGPGVGAARRNDSGGELGFDSSSLRRTAARAPDTPARLLGERTATSTPTRMARSGLLPVRRESVPAGVVRIPVRPFLRCSTSNRNGSPSAVARPRCRGGRRRHTYWSRAETGMHPWSPVFSVQDATVADYSRYRVFEDQLLLAVVLQENRVLIEGPNFTCKLDATDQVNGDWSFVLPNRIQESVLNILCRLVFHDADLRFSLTGWMLREFKLNTETNQRARARKSREPSKSRNVITIERLRPLFNCANGIVRQTTEPYQVTMVFFELIPSIFGRCGKPNFPRLNFKKFGESDSGLGPEAHLHSLARYPS